MTTYTVPAPFKKLFEPAAASVTHFLYLWHNIESVETPKKVNLTPTSLGTVAYAPLIEQYLNAGQPNDLFPVVLHRPIAITPALEDVWSRHVPGLPLRDALKAYVETHVDPAAIAQHAGMLHGILTPFTPSIPAPSIEDILAAPFMAGIEVLLPEHVETRPVPLPHVVRVTPDYNDTRKRAVTAQAYARLLSEATDELPLPDLYAQPGTGNLVTVPPSTNKTVIVDRRDLQSLIELSTVAAYPGETVILSPDVSIMYVEEVDVPKKVADYVAVGDASRDAPIRLHQPPLQRLVHYPYVQPDGTIYSTPGYDRVTGTFLVPNPDSEDGTYPDHSDMPIRDAVRLVAKVLADFPFKHPTARAVGWSFLLAYPFSLTSPSDKKMPIPAHLCRATQQSSGKSNLSRLPQLVFTGQINEPISARGMADDEELTKELQTACADGAPIVGADNVVGMIRSSELAGLLTKSVASFRKFGTNTDKLTLPTPALLTFNGNNLSIDVDLLRRFFVSDLLYDSATNPKYRTPDQFVTKTLDFEAFVRKHRHTIAWATLRIVQETVRLAPQDRTIPDIPLSNFETYQALIVSAIYDVIIPNYPTPDELQVHASSPHPHPFVPSELFRDPTGSQDLAQIDTRPADDLARLFVEFMHPWITELYDDSDPQAPIFVPTRDAAPVFQKALDRVGPLRDRTGREVFVDQNNLRRYLARSESTVNWLWHESYDVPISGEPVINALRQYGLGWEISFVNRAGNVSHIAFTPLKGIQDPLSHFEEAAKAYRSDHSVTHHPILGEIRT